MKKNTLKIWQQIIVFKILNIENELYIINIIDSAFKISILKEQSSPNKTIKKFNFEPFYPYCPLIKSYKHFIIYGILVLNKIYRISVKTWEIISIILPESIGMLSDGKLFYSFYKINNNAPIVFNPAVSYEPYKANSKLYDLNFESEIINYKTRILPFNNITSFVLFHNKFIISNYEKFYFVNKKDLTILKINFTNDIIKKSFYYNNNLDRIFYRQFHNNKLFVIEMIENQNWKVIFQISLCCSK